MNPFTAAKDAFVSLLDFLHDEVNLSYGWAIVAITIMVRLLILPLFLKQYRSMRRMQAYAPQIKELQAKYKGNRQKLNEEMMQFYRDNEINPFSSCLPLVAQLPIFIILYYSLRQFSSEGRGGDLSFMRIIPDVSENLMDIGWGVIVLLVIYATSQLLSSELSMNPATPANQKWMMRLIPLGAVLFVTTYSVPAGVVIYWLTTNLWTCGQQLVMKRKVGDTLFLEGAAAAAAKTGAPPAAAAVKPGQRSSRTPPKAVREAQAAAAAEAAAKGTNGGDPAQKRRRPRKPAPSVADAPEPVEAPEAASAPEPADAPEAGTAPEAAGPPDPGSANGAPAKPPAKPPAKKPKGGSPGGGSGGQRRQPKKKR